MTTATVNQANPYLTIHFFHLVGALSPGWLGRKGSKVTDYDR